MEHLSNPIVQAGGLIVGGAALGLIGLLSRPAPGESNKAELDLQHKEAYEGNSGNMLLLAPCVSAGTYDKLRDALRSRGISASPSGSMSLSVDLTAFLQSAEPEAENEMYDALLASGLVLQPSSKRGEFFICLPSVSDALLRDIMQKFDSFIGMRRGDGKAPATKASTPVKSREVVFAATPVHSNNTARAEEVVAAVVHDDAVSESVEAVLVEEAPKRRGRKSVSSKAAASAPEDDEDQVADIALATPARTKAVRTPSKRKSLAVDESSEAGEVKTTRRRKAT